MCVKLLPRLHCFLENPAHSFIYSNASCGSQSAWNWKGGERLLRGPVLAFVSSTLTFNKLFKCNQMILVFWKCFVPRVSFGALLGAYYRFMRLVKMSTKEPIGSRKCFVFIAFRPVKNCSWCPLAVF